MEYIITIGLFVLTAAIVYLIILSSKNSASTGSDAQNLLINDLRVQLAQTQKQAQQEAQLKTSALQSAAGAEAAKEAALAQLAQEQVKHAEELARLREDSKTTLDATATRYNQDLAELKTAFAKMSTDVLRGMAPDVTKEVATNVTPLIEKISAALESYRNTMQQSLQGQDAALTQVRAQMEKISETTSVLASSTNDFTAVLKSSQHRGKWGEQTLRRVVEAAGLSPHCDFNEQVSQDESRPDLIVKLPGNRGIIIDAKVPDFDVAIAEQNAPNRRDLVKAHATKLSKTIRDLAAKNYPQAIEKTGLKPFDRVVLFLPAESLLSTALEGDNELILEAGKIGILLATPATLIGFLSAINLTWQQHQQAENADRIAREATELYDRVTKFVEHFGKVRKGLNSAVESFNFAVGSYEGRVRPQGERLRELGGTNSRDEFESIPQVGNDLRRLEGSTE
ncbi:MAG: DNA recombination protein RmuC [Verrucomicrobia bacterium]|jgi:DNA recombination protein RmuC|nr:DNA recombination protein RmuC [Verrucomicrobiota bacterium]